MSGDSRGGMLDGYAQRKAPGGSVRPPGKQVCREGAELGRLERDQRRRRSGIAMVPCASAGVDEGNRIPGARDQQPAEAVDARGGRKRGSERMRTDLAEPVLGVGEVAFTAVEQGVNVVAVGVVLVGLTMPMRSIEIVVP